MKVSIDVDYDDRTSKDDKAYWYIAKHRETPDTPLVKLASKIISYPAAVRRAIADGHEISNAGWKRKLLSWNWGSHALQGYPEWEIDDLREGAAPAWCKLTHTRGGKKSEVESNVLCNAWDDIATVGFYQRDWTDNGIPFVSEGTTYWSGWWFATIAERDRFVAWVREREPAIVVTFAPMENGGRRG